MKEGEDNKLSREEKEILRDALRKTGCLPATQGKVLLNISPQTTISSVEITMNKR